MGKRLYTLYQDQARRRRRSNTTYWIGGIILLGALSWIIIRNSEFPETGTPRRMAQPVSVPPAKSTPKSVAAKPTPAPDGQGSNLAAFSPLAPQRVNARSGIRPVRDLLEAQIALDRLGISSGSIDGVAGAQTRRALEVFQREMNLAVTGQFDAATRQVLVIAEPVFTQHTVTADDLASLRPAPASWAEKSRQDRLGHATSVEQLAEKSHAHPALLVRLNPGLDWTALPVGTAISRPRIDPLPATRAARVRIHLASRTMQVFDEHGTLIAHFPCSIAQKVDKRPVGDLRVTVVAPNPDYTFDPALFTESPESRTMTGRLKLPPGPNSPVGTAWIGLDRAGYGIHGTPNPESVGRTESHGCFRLSNWNAERLLRMAWVGMPVTVEP